MENADIIKKDNEVEQTATSVQKELACSYHTFILPVIWEGENGNLDTFEKFTEHFESSPHWTREIAKDVFMINSEEEACAYKTLQYFYPQAREALFDYGNGVVKKFSFTPNRTSIARKAHYYITKNKTYDLLVNSITFSVYNTGVALLTIQCENHGKDKSGNDQSSFADVKAINEYGRRVTMPFVPFVEDEKNTRTPTVPVMCANKLALAFDDHPDLLLTEDFASALESQETISLSFSNHLIEGLLSYDSIHINVQPTIDDRMFVACIACDEETLNAMLPKEDVEGNESAEARRRAYEESDQLSKSLYEFLFIDLDGECSCRSKRSRNKLLEEHLYDRWFDYGSIYGITAHSMVYLLNAKIGHLVESFLNIYTGMISICLVQKASLVHLQHKTAELSANIYKKKINTAAAKSLMNLQERYSAFESQILFTEVSPEEQGIEMYEMISKFFFINDNVENIKSQLQGLNDAVNTDFDFQLNTIVLLLTIAGIILGISGFWSGVVADCKLLGGWSALCLGAPLAALILWYYQKRK